MTVTVIKGGLSAPQGLAAVATQIRGQLGDNVQKNSIETYRIMLAAGDAEEFRYLFKTKAPDGKSIPAYACQYIFVAARGWYAITFAAPVDLREEYRPLFRKSAQTFRLVE